MNEPPAGGVFRLPAGLPPGRYTLAAYHPKAGELTQPITVSSGRPLGIEFGFEYEAQLDQAPRASRASH